MTKSVFSSLCSWKKSDQVRWAQIQTMQIFFVTIKKIQKTKHQNPNNKIL